METILNDAFNPSAYANHVPTQTVAKNKKILNFTVAVFAVILTLVIVDKIILPEIEKKSKGKEAK